MAEASMPIAIPHHVLAEATDGPCMARAIISQRATGGAVKFDIADWSCMIENRLLFQKLWG